MISDKDIEKASEGENLGIEGLAASEEPPFRFSWANFACALAFALAMCILFCGGIA